MHFLIRYKIEVNRETIIVVIYLLYKYQIIFIYYFIVLL
jgi:hypothetical protein